jgi:hypothetical protein
MQAASGGEQGGMPSYESAALKIGNPTKHMTFAQLNSGARCALPAPKQAGRVVHPSGMAAVSHTTVRAVGATARARLFPQAFQRCLIDARLTANSGSSTVGEASF